MTRSSLSCLLVLCSLALPAPAGAQALEPASGLPCNSLCATWLSLGREQPSPKTPATLNRAAVLDLHPTLSEQDAGAPAATAATAVPSMAMPPLPTRRPPVSKSPVAARLRAVKPPGLVASLPVPVPVRPPQVYTMSPSPTAATVPVRPDPPREVAIVVVPPAHDPALDPAFVAPPTAAPPALPVPAPAPVLSAAFSAAPLPAVPPAAVETTIQPKSPPRTVLVMPPPLDVIAALMLQPSHR